MTRTLSLIAALVGALAVTQAHALSGSRAGADDSRHDWRQPQVSDSSCARYRDAIVRLEAQIAREASGSRADRLAASKRQYQKRMTDSGCGRSLR